MIEKWLHNVKPPKYLRYLFFITYSFYRRFTSERSDAHFTAALFIGMLHSIMYTSLFMWTTKLYDKSYLILIIIFIFIQIYFWFWHKQKWKSFTKEFEHLNRKQQLLGGIYLFIYLFICSLPIAIPVYLSLVYDINVYK